MHSFIRYLPAAVLLLNAMAYCYLALLFVLAPEEWFAVLGIELQDPLGYTELKTMYIGLMAALGLYFIVTALRRDMQAPGLLLLIISYLLLAAVRSWGVLVDGLYDNFTLRLLWVELIGAGLGGWAYYCLMRRSKPRPATAHQTKSQPG